MSLLSSKIDTGRKLSPDPRQTKTWPEKADVRSPAELYSSTQVRSREGAGKIEPALSG
jgi:hypothetical protein